MRLLEPFRNSITSKVNDVPPLTTSPRKNFIEYIESHWFDQKRLFKVNISILIQQEYECLKVLNPENVEVLI